MDTRIASSIPALVDEICSYLARHVADPAVVDLARPVTEESLGRMDRGPLWVTVEWNGRQGQARVRRLPDGPLPGTAVADGVTVAHEQAPALVASYSDLATVVVELGLARPSEKHIEAVPIDMAIPLEGEPHHLVGALSAEMAAGRPLEHAAARLGATVAETVWREGPIAGTPGHLSEALIAAERRLGGDFETVQVSGDKVVLRNRRCPFGTATAKGMCRFTSALAGGLASRASGNATVTVAETLAGGDHECRLTVDVGDEVSEDPVSHRYRWPPAEQRSPSPSDPEEERGFRLSLSMLLPRDRLSVPVSRHLLRASLGEVGVIAEDVDAVELALTEACANVIDHSGPGDAYEVSVTIAADTVHIRVVDVGRGFDHAELTTPTMAASDAEHGRGMALMHALVDSVRFESEPERGTVVHLTKMLHFDETTTARRLMLEAGRPPPATD